MIGQITPGAVGEAKRNCWERMEERVEEILRDVDALRKLIGGVVACGYVVWMQPESL